MPISHHHQQSNDELRRSAGEILNGVRRNVEVQIMHPGDLHGYSILGTGTILTNYIYLNQSIHELMFFFRRLSESNIKRRNNAGKWLGIP